MQNQSNSLITFDFQLKTALRKWTAHNKRGWRAEHITLYAVESYFDLVRSAHGRAAND